LFISNKNGVHRRLIAREIKKKLGGWPPPTYCNNNLYSMAPLPTDVAKQSPINDVLTIMRRIDGYHALSFHQKFNVGDKQ